tara:strand:+ start:117 stop:308 length:192 start_codon:yes stop_codon:yes gene_type:complete
MRYNYVVTPEKGETENIQAMSFKKMLKSIVNKYPKQNVFVSYKNKKDRLIEKNIDTSKIKQKD